MQKPRKRVKSSTKGTNKTSGGSIRIKNSQNEAQNPMVDDAPDGGPAPQNRRHVTRNVSVTQQTFDLGVVSESVDPYSGMEDNNLEDFSRHDHSTEILFCEDKDYSFKVNFTSDQVPGQQNGNDSILDRMLFPSDPNHPKTALIEPLESKSDKNPPKPTPGTESKELSPPCEEDLNPEFERQFEEIKPFLINTISSKIPLKLKNGSKVLDLTSSIPTAKLVFAAILGGISEEDMRLLEKEAKSQNKTQVFCFTSNISKTKVGYLFKTGSVNSTDRVLYEDQTLIDAFKPTDTSIDTNLNKQKRKSRKMVWPKGKRFKVCLARFSSSELNGVLADKTSSLFTWRFLSEMLRQDLKKSVRGWWLRPKHLKLTAN